jgi:prepilin-type processing-associated H-X9-DG protein
MTNAAMAIHNYASANGETLPPHLVDDPGNDGLDVGLLPQTQSLHARILPYLEQTVVYNSINWDVPARWGPAQSNPPESDGVNAGIWGVMQMTALSIEVKSFLCPSDPNPGQTETIGWANARRRIGVNNYPNNIGLNRHHNTWAFNGPGWIATQWDGVLKPTVTMATFVDGTANTAIMSEWVKGPSNTDRDGLGMVYQSGINSDTFSGQLYSDWLAAQACQRNGLTRDWGWKGEWWIQGDRQNYSHTQIPNRRACNYANIGVDGRGTITMMGASSLHPGGVNVAFMDGSVKFIKNSIAYRTWYAIATPNGNEVVSQDDFVQ